MCTLCKTVLRGFCAAVCLSLLAMTAQAADSSLSGRRDEAKNSGGAQIEQIQPGLGQVKKDADKISDQQVEKTYDNVEKSLANEPKMTTDPKVKEYIRLK